MLRENIWTDFSFRKKHEKNALLPKSHEDVCDVSNESVRSQEVYKTAMSDTNSTINESTPRAKEGIFRRFTKGLRDILDDSLATPRDFYTASFLVEFISLILICFGWSAFRRHEQYAVSTASLLQENNIPSGLLLYMLMQFLLIVIDRALYLTRSMRGKLLFHCFVTILVHFLVFYWIPLTTLRPFRENTIIMMLYLLKVVYLFLSAAQIQATFPLSVQRNTLTKRATPLGFGIYQIYRVIPFLHELRMLLDWSCTATTLKLNDWYRVEDINGQLFVNQYTIRSHEKSTRRRGEKQPRTQKLLMGAMLIVILIFILWFPLLIMSLINDRAVSNTPNRVEISLRINSYQPIFVMDVLSNNVATNQKDLQQIFDQVAFASSFRSSDVQRVLLSPQSKSVWNISPSSRASLAWTLEKASTVVITFTARFTRSAQSGIVAGIHK